MVDFNSPRLRRFRDQLAELIPCDPEVRADLEQMGLPEFLLRYVNWRDRYVEPRARRVMVWDGFWQHGSPQFHLVAVTELAKRIESCADLKPYLSDRIDRFGYGRATRQHQRPFAVEWEDKDYVLNAFGVHHLHLTPQGTDELLYVSFSRD